MMSPPTARLCRLLPLLLLLASGCPNPDADTRVVAPGVVYRNDKSVGVYLLDVDLATAAVRPAVVSANVARMNNNFVGDAKTVRDWATETGALGGINAGFFGETYDTEGKRKQTIGLLVQEGKTVAPAVFVNSTKFPGEKFLRSAIGFGPDGTPDIAWATGLKDGLPRAHSGPVNPESSDTWRVRSAVACGPRLFAAGARHITDTEERLVSRGKLARAFVAFDRVDGRPRHLVLGRGDGMEFADVADYLTAYFARYYGTTPYAALCMDGGPSAQVVYRDPDTRTLTDAVPTGVQVPTALLLLPR